MNYYKEFIKAVQRTEDWGFNPGEVFLDKTVSYLDKDSHFELFELFERNYKGLLDQTKMDCTNVSINMLDLVRDYFCTDAFLTTGNISMNNFFLFECSLDYLKILAGGNKFNPKLKVHMWITLSSGEIIDFTFFRSIAKAFPRFESTKSLILTTPMLQDFQLVYSPMIIGIDFYKKTGNMLRIVMK